VRPSYHIDSRYTQGDNLLDRVTSSLGVSKQHETKVRKNLDELYRRTHPDLFVDETRVPYNDPLVSGSLSKELLVGLPDVIPKEALGLRREERSPRKLKVAEIIFGRLLPEEVFIDSDSKAGLPAHRLGSSVHVPKPSLVLSEISSEVEGTIIGEFGAYKAAERFVFASRGHFCCGTFLYIIVLTQIEHCNLTSFPVPLEVLKTSPVRAINQGFKMDLLDKKSPASVVQRLKQFLKQKLSLDPKNHLTKNDYHKILDFLWDNREKSLKDAISE